MRPPRKVALERIKEKTHRKASMRKRTAGLINKVREITTLCDAEAAVVIYKPDDSQPTVWPSTSAARATISEYLSRPGAERNANSHTAKSFIEEQCRKKKEKAQQLIKNNEERNVQTFITSIYEGKTRIQDLDSETKKRLDDYTDQKLKDIRKHIQRLKKEQQAPNSAQVLPPSVQMPPVSQATSGLNMNGLGAGTICQSPVAAPGQLMDVGGMARFSPALTLPLPTSNHFVMLPNNTTLYKLDMTESFHGPSNFDGIMQQKAFSLAQQMPSVSQVADSLEALNIYGFAGGENYPFSAAEAHGPVVDGLEALNIDDLATGGNFQFPAAEAHGLVAGSLEAPNINGPAGGGNFPFPAAEAHGQVADGVETLNISGLAGGGNFPFPAAGAHGQDMNLRGTNSLDMTVRLYRQTTPGGTTQLLVPYPSSTAYSEESVPHMTGYSLINGSTRANNREMEQHRPPPSLPLDFSHTHLSSNTFDMTGRLYEQTNVGNMMQHFLPSPLQSMTSGVDMTDNGLNNACTRTFTGDGNFGEMMQDAPPSDMLMELRLRQPPMPSIQYNASGSNMSGANYSGSRIGFLTPGTTALEQSNFGDDYRLDTDGIPRTSNKSA